MPEIQQPDILGNYLTNYRQSQQYGQQQQDRQFNQQRVAKQDEIAQQDHDYEAMQRKNEMIARAAMQLNTPELWAQHVPAVMKQLGINTPPPAFGERDRIIAESMSVKEQLDRKMQEQKFGLDQRQTEAQIAQAYSGVRANDAQAGKYRAEAANVGAGGGGGSGGGVSQHAPSGYRYVQGPDGGFVLAPIPGGPADPANRSLTEAEGKAVGYANRLQEANAKLEQFGHALGSLNQSLKGSVPIAGNYMVSGDYQQASQAERDFINAQLRRESGAVISDAEFVNARKQYIPQPGDRPEVLAQKAAARALAFRNMRTAAGPGGSSRIETAPTTKPAASSGGWTIERVK